MEIFNVQKYVSFKYILKYFCLPITFNNPLKACFSNKKYLNTIPTQPTQIILSIFRIKKTGFKDF